MDSLRSLNAAETPFVQQGWKAVVADIRMSLDIEAATIQSPMPVNRWRRVHNLPLQVSALTGLPLSLASLVAAMFLSARVFEEERLEIATLESQLTNDLPRPVKLNIHIFDILYEKIMLPRILAKPILPNLQLLSHWNMLKTKIAQQTPTAKKTNVSYSTSIPLLLDHNQDIIPLPSVSAQISVADLEFNTAATTSSSIFPTNPLLDARNDASRLALTFLERYDAIATSLMKKPEGTDILNHIDDTAASKPWLFIYALDQFCEEKGLTAPEYRVEPVEGGMPQHICCVTIIINNQPQKFWGDKAARKKESWESAARKACESLQIPTPSIAVTKSIPKPSIKPHASEIPDMGLLNTYCQRNKLSLSVVFPAPKISDTAAQFYSCVVSIDGVGTWHSDGDVEHASKNDAKSSAAKNAAVSLGLRGPVEVECDKNMLTSVAASGKRKSAGLNSDIKKPKIHGLPPKPSSSQANTLHESSLLPNNIIGKISLSGMRLGNVFPLNTSDNDAV